MTRDERRGRPTIRCLTEDLGLVLPGPDVDLGLIDDPLMAKLRRVAPTSPRGQKRVLVVGERLVYRIRAGGSRGATWVDETHPVVWLLAAGPRQEGSKNDVYVHVGALQRAGRLFPEDDDYLRDRVEAASRLLDTFEAEAVPLVGRARSAAGLEVSQVLAELIAIRLYVQRDQEIEEIWLAVSTVDVNGSGIRHQLRDLIFAIFEQVIGETEWEWRSDWPTGELAWFELARLGIRRS